mgnify:CR=1 FL=1
MYRFIGRSIAPHILQLLLNRLTFPSGQVRSMTL